MEELRGILGERRELLRQTDKVHRDILALRTRANQSYRLSRRNCRHLRLVAPPQNPALLEINGQIDSLLVRYMDLRALLDELDRQITRLTGLRLA